MHIERKTPNHYLTEIGVLQSELLKYNLVIRMHMRSFLWLNQCSKTVYPHRCLRFLPSDRKRRSCISI